MTAVHSWSKLNEDLSPESLARIAELEAEIDATMPPDESCPVVPLRMLREFEEIPLSEFKAELGLDKDGILAFEECDDAPVSQVAAYIKATGGRLKLVAEYPEGDDVIIANFYRKRRWPARANDTLFGEWGTIPVTAVWPVTCRQLEWAAQTGRLAADATHADAVCRKVNTPRFRAALRGECDGAVIEQLLGALNLSDNADAALADALLVSVPDALATLRHLADADLCDVVGDGMSTWESILARRAVERLMADDGVDVILASQILAVANPALFVPWDGAAQQTFFPHNDPDDGFAPVRYARFVWAMAEAARAIRQDARIRHGADDPAAQISAALGISPPWPLPRFIAEYNRRTLTEGVPYPYDAPPHNREHPR